jgi:hypothetical protein
MGYEFVSIVTELETCRIYKSVLRTIKVATCNLSIGGIKFYSTISDNETSTEARQEGESAQDPFRKIMTSWTFNVKFSYDTEFTFGSLTFTTEEDENLKILTPGPALECLTPVYGEAPYHLAISSTSADACSGLDPCVCQYIRTARFIRGIPIGSSIL